MRTNIVIDDQWVADAMKLSGVKTKREVVKLALRRLVSTHFSPRTNLPCMPYSKGCSMGYHASFLESSFTSAYQYENPIHLQCR